MRPKPTPALLAATALAAGWALPAAAHPHVFAEARLDVVVEEGSVTSLRHLWRFDDLFSSTVLVEFDQNGDLELDAEELDEVGKVVHESLAEYGYFQIVTVDGKPVDMQPPDRIVAQYMADQLVILFESRPTDDLRLTGTLDFGIYDPTFYTAIEFVEDASMAVDNLPAGCSRSVVRPDPDEAIAQNQQTLTDAFFEDPAGTDMSKIFATRLELSCAG